MINIIKKIINKLTFDLLVYNHVKKGVRYEERGDIDRAEKEFMKALHLNPNNVNTKLWVVYLCSKKKKLTEALELLNTISSCAPDVYRYWYNLAFSFAEEGEIDKAIQCYEKSLELNVSNNDATINLGILYGKKGLFNEALDLFSRAYNKTPQDAILLTSIGNVLCDMKRPYDAIDYYLKALQLEPHNAGLFLNLGIAQFEADFLENAETSFTKAISLENNDPRPYYYLGKIYRERGIDKKAVDYFREAAAKGHKKSLSELESSIGDASN